MGDEVGTRVSMESLLPKNHISLGYVVVFKVLDPDGDVALMSTLTEDITQWEAVGMHDWAIDQIKSGAHNE